MVNICLCRTSDASPVFSASLPFKKRKFNIQESTTSSTEDDNSEAIKQNTCDTQSVILNKSAANIQESTTSSTEDGNGEAIKQSTCNTQPANESTATTECTEGTEADNVAEPADLDSIFTSERYLYIMQH